MNFSEIFVKRPIATSLLMLGIAAFGLVAYFALSVADVPPVAYPSLHVHAILPGADPETMASAVASPLERQFTTIAGLNSMTSSSSIATTNIFLQFDMGRNIDRAAVDVQTAIAEAMPLLPPGMPSPPWFIKTNPADDPIVDIALTSPTLPMSALDDYAETLIAPHISMLDGVSEVDVNGAQKYAVRVQVDPDKLWANHIGLNEVNQALRNWNVNLPMGELFGPSRTYTLQANGQLWNAAAFRPIILGYHNGAPVRLGQVAKVIDSVENNQNFSWLYTKKGVQRAIGLGVRATPTANTIKVSDRVRRLFPFFRKELPPSVHMTVTTDLSQTIRQSFHDIQLTLLVTLALVVGVIFLFLHSRSATIIPALALPLSILGTFAVMEVLGFTLDNLSMMALILSVGFIVDDAIVMLENIARHLEHGERPLDAALNGAKEVGFTVISMTTSLVAAFIPLLFMGGILGIVFREFAITISITILISGIVSLTLTPMLCSRFLRAAAVQAGTGFARWVERCFGAMLHGYERSLRVALRHRGIMLAVFILVFLATIQMFRVIPKGFVPNQDSDTLSVNLRAAQGTSAYEMARYAQQAGAIINRIPEVKVSMVSIGGNVGANNRARIRVQLQPRAMRTLTATQVGQKIRIPLSKLSGIRASIHVPPSIQVGSRFSNLGYTATMRSPNTRELYAWAPRMEEALRRLPGLEDVSSDMEITSPQVSLHIDRDKAVALGLNARDIENTLYDGFGQKWSSTIYGANAQYQVLLELNPKYQEHADSLQKVAFKASDGALIPLESVASFKESVGPETINHVGQFPAVSISFGLRPGMSLGAAVDDIRQIASRLLPATITTGFEGSAKVFESSMGNLGLLLFVAIGVVYIVLGILYESYIHPITILSGLPSAGLGALVTLWLFGRELNIYSFVGLIMLVGIVEKNAIMQIDFALEAERQHDKAPPDAIYEGCVIRFRPIMMTTMSALLAALPIAFGFGAGGKARQPLGLAVAGGLVVSQLITLYLTPVIYTYLATIFKTRKIPVTSESRPANA